MVPTLLSKDFSLQLISLFPLSSLLLLWRVNDRFLGTWTLSKLFDIHCHRVSKVVDRLSCSLDTIVPQFTCSFSNNVFSYRDHVLMKLLELW